MKFNGIGRLTKDFEIRMTPSDVEVATSRIAVDVDDTDDTRFYDITVWEPAKWFATEGWLTSNFQKGSLISVQGTIKQRSYVARDGSDRVTQDISAYALGPVWQKPKRDV